MTAATGRLPRPSLWSRIYGLGSVFAKTVRDSRRATIIAAVGLALVFIGVSAAIISEFDTPESRLELENLVNAVPPILQGMAGKVVNVGTLGGYLQYKYGVFFPLVVSLWSILALSGTLAGEAQRGSLEFVAATGKSRRRIALEKLSGHVLMLGRRGARRLRVDRHRRERVRRRCRATRSASCRVRSARSGWG